jgi:transposase InsO family protein
MAYSTNPNLPKARALAMQLLIREQLPLQTVANRCGVHRSTVWRWKRKWDALNAHVQFQNDNRPSVPQGIAFRFTSCTWLIPTYSSRPRTSPQAIEAWIVARVLEVREQLKRCAEVVWHHATQTLGIEVSLSSVRRILRRHHCFDGARKKRVRPDNPRRPKATKPGELVETDTIHHVDPFSGKRLYYYTVIDLYTRMTHVSVSTQLRQGLAAQAILAAQAAFGFSFAMVQSDNGPEFGRYFEQTLRTNGIALRHTRLGRPNDNAHIERFNRTLQEECIGHYWRRSVPLRRQQEKLTNYIDYYNTKRVHLGIQMRTPAEMLQRS